MNKKGEDGAKEGKKSKMEQRKKILLEAAIRMVSSNLFLKYSFNFIYHSFYEV